MNTGGVQFVRRKDFRLSLALFPLVAAVLTDNNAQSDEFLQQEFAEAIYRVRPTFLGPRLTIDVYQPVLGNVHTTVMRICKYGIATCSVDTLLPDRSDLVNSGDRGQLSYSYENGKVIEQHTLMSRDVIDGDDFLTHVLLIEFESGNISANEWVPPKTLHKVRPLLEVVKTAGTI
jgi:hypothetical protein